VRINHANVAEIFPKSKVVDIYELTYGRLSCCFEYRLAKFFAQFPEFDYNPTAPVNQKCFFYQQLGRSEDEKKAFKSAFGKAMRRSTGQAYIERCLHICSELCMSGR